MYQVNYKVDRNSDTIYVICNEKSALLEAVEAVIVYLESLLRCHAAIELQWDLISGDIWQTRG